MVFSLLDEPLESSTKQKILAPSSSKISDLQLDEDDLDLDLEGMNIDENIDTTVRTCLSVINFRLVNDVVATNRMCFQNNISPRLLAGKYIRFGNCPTSLHALNI